MTLFTDNTFTHPLQPLFIVVYLQAGPLFKVHDNLSFLAILKIYKSWLIFSCSWEKFFDILMKLNSIRIPIKILIHHLKFCTEMKSRPLTVKA